MAKRKKQEEKVVKNTRKTKSSSKKNAEVEAAQEVEEIEETEAVEETPAPKSKRGKAAKKEVEVVEEETHIEHVTKVAEKAAKAAKKAGKSVLDAGAEAGSALSEAAEETASAARQALQDATAVASEAISEAVEEAAKAVRQVTQEAVDTATHAAQTAGQDLADAAQDVVKAAKKAAKELQRSAEEILTEAQDVLREAVPSDPVAQDQSLVSSQIKADPSAPEVSIVIPVYNEEGIITSSVEDLVRKLAEMNWSYELILAENGSRDATTPLANNLASRFPTVRVIHAGEPNYGKAMRLGILEARGEYVICDEIDLCDTRFYRDAMGILRSDAADMVVGSKLLASSLDNRGWFRNTASQVLNNMLRVAVGFEGTDTHGLKAFRRDRILRLVEACQVDKDLFASELVIRVWRSPSRIKEIPLQIEEKRKPSINLVRRVPNVLKNMGKLVWLFRVRGGM